MTTLHEGIAVAHVREAVEAACAKIAPAWPLDRMIAVNPYWGWTSRPVQQAAAELSTLSGSPFLMPRAWYREKHAAGAIPSASIERALVRNGAGMSEQDVLAEIGRDPVALPRHPLVCDIRDELRDPLREATWHEHVVQQVGLACAAYFDGAQAAWRPNSDAGFYGFWRSLAAADTSPQLLLGDRHVRTAVMDLPESHGEVITEALETLALPRAAQEPYLTALLLSLQGWASHAAFKRWDARLCGGDDATIEQILAVLLAWELLLYRTAAGTDLPVRWTRARKNWQAQAADAADALGADWAMQRAFETRYQDKLAAALTWHPSLRHADTGASAPGTVSAQAVFCIDVRSEVIRRHLEEVSPDIRTLGFAGFFGVPLAYESLAGDIRPQLPGLLSVSLVACDNESAADASSAARLSREAEQRLRRITNAAPTAFPMVETVGLASALKLALASFDPTRPQGDSLRAGRDLPDHGTAPTRLQDLQGQALPDATRVALAAGILRGMSLVKGFAPLVALVGHGALVTNNPQAAGLACGACGGQSGEVNARVAAHLLNDPKVRQGLLEVGIEIPSRTRFVGALHDTVTDDVRFYPDIDTAASHASELATLRRAFEQTTTRVRAERATRLGDDLPKNHLELKEALQHRAADWSEVRPEWALAGNASFVAAPRSRSRALDLKGRAFLHEYDPQLDPQGTVLETILTAPVVVAHWINFQYWASTVDPSRYGSGDKTRHNVVGGTIGVVEGAGGDLRIGLAHQSVHDGERFVHEPMRLAVYVEASAEMLDFIIAKHRVLQQLVDGEWIFVYRLDPHDGGAFLRRSHGWEQVSAGAASRW